MVHNNTIFILVRPEFLGNLGSVARVMKNFGFLRLRLVEPPKNYLDSEARRMSVAAFDVLKKAEVFATLSDALKDISFALGTTSGQQRELNPIPIDEMAPELSRRVQDGNLAAIVFGDEKNGLGRSELQRCHHTVTVPTNPNFPALNLAQAVGICAYELDRSHRHHETAVLLSNHGQESHPAGVQYPNGAADDELFQQLALLLNRAEFSRTFNADKVVAEIRGLYHRAHPTSREADLLKGALIRINQKLSDS